MHHQDYNYNEYHAAGAAKERAIIRSRQERMERQAEIRRARDAKKLCVVFFVFLWAIVIWLKFF